MTDHRYDCLLLDFGGVCLLNPVEMHWRAEEVLGLPAGTFGWLGPLDPATDELWQRMIAGDGLTERDYWRVRATEVGSVAGRELDTRSYMSMLYDPPTAEMVRPEASAVVERAREAGLGVSVLSNDLRTFHGPDWEKGVAFLGLVDHIVDCSEVGAFKPDPRTFERARDVTGVDYHRMLFVDDQPINVHGAEAVGIESEWFDIADASAAWWRVAGRLGLT